MTDHIVEKRKINLKTLKPRKHKQLDFFIADEVDIITFRDEMESMEHPFFALKGGDTKIREYKNGNVTITIKATSDGMATIFDKDIWIYAISKLQQSINNGEEISRTIAFTPYDFFVTTNRDKGGRSYEELRKALSRLSGTRVQTNIIHSEEKIETEDFGLIDRWVVIEEQKGKLDVGMVKITLPDWLYQGVVSYKKILKINKDYFRIRKPIDRRIYEIARKHCGSQHEFIISLEKLHLKTGSTSLLKKFRHNIKELSKLNDLPDYEISYFKDKDQVIFKNRNQRTLEIGQSLHRKSGKKAIYNIKKHILTK